MICKSAIYGWRSGYVVQDTISELCFRLEHASRCKAEVKNHVARGNGDAYLIKRR